MQNSPNATSATPDVSTTGTNSSATGTSTGTRTPSLAPGADIIVSK